MRKCLIIVFLFWGTGIFAFESDKNLNDEKIAIRQVIKRERKAFYHLDMKCEKDIWNRKADIVFMQSSGRRLEGWKSIHQFYRSVLNSTPDSPENFKHELVDEKIVISGNHAWVLCRENVQFDIAFWKKYKMNNYIIAILQKMQDEWKIVYQMVGRQRTDQSFVDMEAEINALGYKLLKMQKPDQAIKMFKLNVDYFPESFNVYDSIAEAYMVKNDKENAILNYKKSLALNPENQNAIDQLKKLEP